MNTKYQPKEFEAKWRETWKKEKINDFRFKTLDDSNKFYTLVELPYTSGDLHVGHWFSFTIPDVLARFKRMNGFNVFYPIGYDAFGLPAENAAIKRNIHPKDWTLKNIENMTKQFQTMGTMLNNWDDVVITCLPEFYKWNQWIFLKMYERGLAYRGKALSNWCEFDQTVLANENIENGKCWRCGNPVVQKQVEQWFLKITKYADRLLWKDKRNPQGSQIDPTNPEGSRQENVDWPMQVKVGQNNWIGKKEGVLINHKVVGQDLEFESFSAFPAWLWADTYIVIAPEHPLIKKLVQGTKYEKEAMNFVKKMGGKTQEERLKEIDTKEGVFTGRYAKDPFGGEAMPIWIANFALMDFGTGIIRCSSHDKRDYEFAKKYKIELKEVVERTDKNLPIDAHVNKGVLKNSGPFTGKKIEESIQDIIEWIVKNKIGKRHFNYHLRDWSISRQRYWGTPVPIIYCRKCWEIRNSKSEIRNKFEIKNSNEEKQNNDSGQARMTLINGKEYMINPVPFENLPVELPYEVDFTPKGKPFDSFDNTQDKSAQGKPPLATNEKWVNVNCPNCGKPAKRDAETLDTFFDSAWYWYRYVSPHYSDGPFSTDAVERLTPVDVYFGGAEHTLGHTMYARFFTKFFKDEGLVGYEEFAAKRVQHGVVLGPDGNRMSKSKGNVINPDDVVAEYGTDTVRMYLCFMMPYEATGPWSDKTIAGVHRFLNRVWKMYQAYKVTSLPGYRVSKLKENKDLVVKLNKTIQKVASDIEKIKMNTAIASMMELVNEWEGSLSSSATQFLSQRESHQPNSAGPLESEKIAFASLSRDNAKKFLQILAPFAPHMTEEIWRNIFGEKFSIHLSEWPKVDEKVLVEQTVKIPVQINGKVRSVISLSVNQLSEKEVVNLAIKDEKVKQYVVEKKYKAIYVKGKILNLVIG